MKWILSRYNHDISYLKDYTNDYVLYDRSEKPLENSIVVPNIGSDIYDKFTFIIDNYDSLPDVAVYTKANLFKYITKEEFEKVKNNKTFTPLHTMNHRVYEPVCRYTKDGMYQEINNLWYLAAHPTKYNAYKLMSRLGILDKKYVKFSPGSNYIVPKENILQHSKEFYQELRGYLGWAVYPGEAQIIERALWYLWR